MKFWVGVLCAAALTGCDKADVKACEGFIKDSLASPSSYSRINVTRWKESISKKKLDELRQPLGFERGVPSLSLVGIQYDAENSYGAKLRQGEICAFELRDGKPADDMIIASKARSSATTARLRRVIDEGALEGTRPGSMGKAKKYDCCL